MSKKTIFNNRKIIYIVLFVIIFFITGGAFLVGYYVGGSVHKEEKNKTLVQHEDNTKKALNELQNLVDENLKKIKEENRSKLLEKNVLNSEVLDYQDNKKDLNLSSEFSHKNPLFSINNKPKLVIIMDDMSFNYQVKELKKLHLRITPSFFPPTKIHPKSAIYAKEFSHYMVHFPMQATNPFFKEEEDTLHINSDYNFIDNRIKYIKKEFPKVRFINNHTGSKFTSDYNSMNKLYIALNKYNLIFVDSKTTYHTKAPILAKKYKQILLSRDVFLDNKPDIIYIQNQLKKAIKIAKKRGYAIAICHPHKTTFKALMKSKNLLKDVEVIYIDELYKLYQLHKLSKL